MNHATQSQSSDRLAIPAPAVAELLSISERHVWALNASGRLPRPFRLGRAVRWSVDELLAWQRAGCPLREHWERLLAREDER